MAAKLKADIWKEPAVGITCEPAAANHAARLVCRDQGLAVVLWDSTYSPALLRSSPAWSGKAGAALQ